MGKSRAGTPNGNPKPYRYWSDYHGRERWRYQIELTPVGASKRIRVVGSGETPSEAIKKAHIRKKIRLAQSLAPGTTVKSPKKALTFEDFSEMWLDDVKGKIQESTRDGYRAVLKNHVNPAMGHLAMWRIDKNDIKILLSQTLPEKKKPDGSPLLGHKRMILIYRLLKMMFKTAVDDYDLVVKNPVVDSFAPRKPIEQPLTKRQRIPERTEIALDMLERALKNMASEPLTYVWLMLMINGLRQGERGGLSWSDCVNLDKYNEASIRITKQLAHEGGGRGNYLKEAVKTEGSYRSIPLSEDDRRALLTLKEKREQEKKSPGWGKGWDDERIKDLVLLTEKGQPYTQGRDQRLWQTFLKNYAGENKNDSIYQGWTGHVWRKICASLYVNGDIHPEIARRILGHTHSEMTSYYQDLKDDDIRVGSALVARRRSAVVRQIEKIQQENTSRILGGKSMSSLSPGQIAVNEEMIKKYSSFDEKQ